MGYGSPTFMIGSMQKRVKQEKCPEITGLHLCYRVSPSKG
jgi:hypothetical protein